MQPPTCHQKNKYLINSEREHVTKCVDKWMFLINLWMVHSFIYLLALNLHLYDTQRIIYTSFTSNFAQANKQAYLCPNMYEI